MSRMHGVGRRRLIVGIYREVITMIRAVRAIGWNREGGRNRFRIFLALVRRTVSRNICEIGM